MQMEFSAREIPSHEKTAEYRQIKTLRSCMNLNKKADKRKLGLEEKECRCYIFDKKDLSGSLSCECGRQEMEGRINENVWRKHL